MMLRELVRRAGVLYDNAAYIQQLALLSYQQESKKTYVVSELDRYVFGRAALSLMHGMGMTDKEITSILTELKEEDTHE